MRTVGIIAEYNPFHTGHEYHLKKAREAAGADYAVVVMSPDFVQRGEPAVFDKYTRAKMALLGGADLVLELPVCYATGSAEYFAEGAVALLHSIGADALCFGCETPDTALFRRTAEILCREPEACTAALRTLLTSGYSFPKARAAALTEYLASEQADSPLCPEPHLHDFLASPNNILGIEYCKALQKLDSEMEILPIRRLGSGYHDKTTERDFCSATALRHVLNHGLPNETVKSGSSPEVSRHALDTESAGSVVARNIPVPVLPLFRDAAAHIITPDDFLPFLNQRLLSDGCFDSILDISPDLSDRLSGYRYQCMGKSWDETVSLLCTKQMTNARIRRSLLHLVLNITSADTESFRRDGIISYARILGFRRDAAPLLHEIKEKGTVPLLTKTAHASKLLNESGQKMLAQNFFASHLYRSVSALKYGTEFRTEYEISPVIV